MADPIPHGVQIPLLTLQPLVENAIYHGIQPLPEGGLIRVEIHIDDERVEIVLTNPVPPEGTGGVRHTTGNAWRWPTSVRGWRCSTVPPGRSRRVEEPSEAARTIEIRRRPPRARGS